VIDVEIPERVARLPRDGAGRPIPWFTAIVDGRPDLRVSDPDKTARAVAEGRCWICGDRFDRSDGSRMRTFIVGPTSAFSRLGEEPPSHRRCALYAARSCPFLSNPGRARRPAGLPASVERLDDDGFGPVLENPGVVLLWMCRRYDVDWLSDGLAAFRLPYPSGLYAYCGGLPALRDQLDAAVDVAERQTRDRARDAGVDPAEVDKTVKSARHMIRTRMR
jgi:hypothetical protein